MRRFDRLLPCTLLALMGLACASDPRTEPHAGLAELWAQYQEMSDKRALAIAGDPDRVWVGAASGGHASLREAEESVLATCWQRRATRRFQEKCRLYAVGDEIVW